MISNCSRLFSKTFLVNSKPTYPAFSLRRALSIHLLQVRTVASESAASSTFKKIQIQRDDTAFDAYVIGKEEGPGIVVLQEWLVDTSGLSDDAANSEEVFGKSAKPNDDIAMLISQMHDLSFMLKSDLSIPSKSDSHNASQQD